VRGTWLMPGLWPRLHRADPVLACGSGGTCLAHRRLRIGNDPCRSRAFRQHHPVGGGLVQSPARPRGDGPDPRGGRGLDRLAEFYLNLIELMQELERREIGFKSFAEAIDTTSPGGRLAYHLFASLEEFERSVLRERTRAGLEAARQRGRRGGRPRSFNTEKLNAARRLLNAGTPVREVAVALGVSVPTIYRHLPAAERSNTI
jgi:hypothetical protein